ncbi:hypothetical protein [Pelosinus sp. UFO1]|uniref:hypothetical protein n=1 Tax=Pelosinus sp. UFO1 TaxID=484770 RepID=UPI0004D0DE09|nr:hypothetical protein [Pelosinus sp. UFO1]AIF51986.1 hypothetical protein UFO1_2439 [Pelosinus sp. UFO1]
MIKTLIMLLLLFSIPYTSAATPNSDIVINNIDKVLLGFKYSNTSTWGMTTRSVHEDIIDKNVAPVLIKNNCEIVTDIKYLDKLQSKGYADSTSAEKADLLDIYKDDGFLYLIFIEVDPVRRAAGMGYESSAHVKIIDMRKSNYIFSGKVNGMTKWGGAGTASSNVGKEIRKILEEKVFPPKM